jgi:hypothetical protein
MGLYVVLSPGFIWMVLGQVAFWSALVVLLRRQRRLLALGVVWKIVFFLPVFNLYWNPAFTHYRYLPHLGTAWIAGLAAWELSGCAAGLLRRWGRPAVRWALVGAGLLILLLHYRSQLDLQWAPVSFMLKGGHPPPESFCRDLHGPDAPFDVVDRDPAAP